ncbi:MAG: hypothetical protein NC543_04930 [bacterium]|nr:hypothetical protein [bacterium]MCM1374883.1 hypothetical protein [Muribaculum sp.]
MKEEKNNYINNNGTLHGNTSLLQIGVIFLAVVSFFTTANGMNKYIFPDEKFVAYAASAAIQCILLALSMNLPKYLRSILEHGKNWFTKFLMCFATIVLTIVAIFCSSWFSYVFIAETLHQDSWDVDSELLVQQNYRTELYDAWDYAQTYRIYLEENMGEKILLIENQARQLSDNSMDSTVVWEEERENYVENGGMTAASYMSTVIDAMQKAMQNSSQDERDFAATAVADAKENIAARMETIQQNLDILDANVTNYNNRIADLTRRIDNATEDTNTAELSASINSYTQLINRVTQQQVNLQTESMQLDNALLRLSFYESLLGLSSSTSAISVRSKLMQLQSEFFQQNPDEAKMLDIAEDIFNMLRNASHSSTTAEGNAIGIDEELTYTNLLIQMNQLIRNLTDYSKIKIIEANLDNLISQLSQIDADIESGIDVSEPVNMVSESEDDSMEFADESSEASEVETQPSGEDDIVFEENNEIIDTSRETVESDMESNNDNLEPVDTNNTFSQWRKNLDTLKAQISALPVYNISEEVLSGTTGALSEAQINILQSYNRNESSRHLDDIIRRYVISHNAIYEGIIYLQSPYRSLAIFALILAFSFDIAGFIFGVVIQKESSQQTLPDGDNGAEWGIVKTLNHYRVLTGDFENRDGVYYYKVFDNGILESWVVHDEVPYKRGIYAQDEQDPHKGKFVGDNQKPLLFAEQSGGPVDGIYMNCRLVFNEGSVISEQNGAQRQFIANANEYVPVHSYNPQKGENQTLPAKEMDIEANVAVIALNTKGTRICAIYIIEQ